MRNPYEVLGVPRSASLADIKKKYRSLAKENHPDRKPGDKAASERFKEINAAYDIVGDEKKRARFDKGEIDADGRERVHSGFGQGFPGGAPGGRPGAGGFGGFQGRPGAGGGDARFEDFGMGFNFDDLFSAFRGQTGAAGARQAPPQEPSTAGEFEMEVDFLDAARGAIKRITVDGRSFDVSIPAGIEAGQTVRMRDKDVDLRILINNVKPHPFFTRQGDDIHLDLPVTVVEAVRGAKVDVPTIHGVVTLNIPPGSNTGTMLRLKGQGVRRKGKKEGGNQVARLQVSLPEEISGEVEEALVKWEKRNPYDPRKKLR